MNTWKIVLATVVIFGAGVVTGGLLVNHAHERNVRQMRRITNALETWRARPAELLRSARENPRPLLEQRRLEFVLAVQRKLKLTPEQRTRIEQIVRQGQEITRQITESIRPQLREHWAEVNRKIRAELTPQQRERFDELLKKRPWAQHSLEQTTDSPPRTLRNLPGQNHQLPPMYEQSAPAELAP